MCMPVIWIEKGRGTDIMRTSNLTGIFAFRARLDIALLNSSSITSTDSKGGVERAPSKKGGKDETGVVFIPSHGNLRQRRHLVVA